MSWSLLPDVSIDNYFYEIGIAEIISDHQNCSNVVPNTMPLSYANTSTNRSIEVTDLKTDTCYEFGVRVYSTITGQPGEWNIRVNSILPSGIVNCFFHFSLHALTYSIVVSIVSSSDEQLSITLSWSATDGALIYEVAYSSWPPNAAQQCTNSGGVNTLPDGYTLFGNTSDTSIVVTGLQPGTCYVFGVRTYISTFQLPGNWTITFLISFFIAERKC